MKTIDANLPTFTSDTTVTPRGVHHQGQAVTKEHVRYASLAIQTSAYTCAETSARFAGLSRLLRNAELDLILGVAVTRGIGGHRFLFYSKYKDSFISTNYLA